VLYCYYYYRYIIICVRKLYDNRKYRSVLFIVVLTYVLNVCIHEFANVGSATYNFELSGHDPASDPVNISFYDSILRNVFEVINICFDGSTACQTNCEYFCNNSVARVVFVNTVSGCTKAVSKESEGR